MISIAARYRNNTTYLNSYHINDPYGECPSRTKPRYLTTAKNYSSVPYAWGIADTVAQFNSFMNGGNNCEICRRLHGPEFRLREGGRLFGSGKQCLELGESLRNVHIRDDFHPTSLL